MNHKGNPRGLKKLQKMPKNLIKIIKYYQDF